VKAPVYKAPPPVPVYSWTGFYVGVEGGYAWRDRSVSFSPNDAAGAAGLGSTNPLVSPIAAGPAGFTNKGSFGGIEAGYNWQFDRSWVAGVEADINASDIHGQGTVTFPVGGGGTAIAPNFRSITASQKISWFGTIRARLGWLAGDNLLIYGTGGFA
jgi:outer membrane immunogenic protein